MEKIKILTMGRHDFWAMFTVKHRLPCKSDVKGDNKGWLHKCFQTTSAIYLNKKGSHGLQLSKIR